MRKMLILLILSVFLPATGGELVPVINGEAVVQQEEILLDSGFLPKYKTNSLKKIESYSETHKKEDKAVFKKGRVSVGAKIPDQKHKAASNVLLEPNIQVTDEFSLLFSEKVDPRALNVTQGDVGVKYSPKKLKGSSFSVSGGSSATSQKLKFSTDLLLW